MGASLSALSVVEEETCSGTLVQQRPQNCKKRSPHVVGCRLEKSVPGEGFREEAAFELGLQARVGTVRKSILCLGKSKNIATASYTFPANKTEFLKSRHIPHLPQRGRTQG